MLIQTQADALAALQQAQTDLQNTQTQLQTAFTNSQGFWSTLSGSSISQKTEDDAQGLIGDLETQLITLLNSLGGADTDPLQPVQVDGMKALQSQIINARSIVNQVISQVDWSFGDYVSDFGGTAVNTASQAVAAVASGLGTTYKFVQYGLAVGVALLVLYVGYRVMR